MIFCLGLLGCGTTYQGKDIYGADEFVTDSYKIRQGKMSILQLEGQDIGEYSASFLEEYPDSIQDGDVLQIALYHPKRQDLTEAVASIGGTIGYSVIDGKIILPDLGGVRVSGLSLRDAAKEIEKKYLTEIQDVEIFVSYQNRTVRKVDIAGVVNTSIPVDGKKRLFEICCQAGIPASANLFKSYILRDGKFLAIDIYKLLKEGDMKYNIVMRGGDKIYIAETSDSSLMVMGEVGHEMVLNLPHGSISLREALAAAGGVPYTGDKSFIQIIRGNILSPKIYVVSWEHVIHLPNDSLLLMPGDIVYVATKPITEWNRFVSQLLPTVAALDMARGQARNVGILVK